MSWGYKCNPNCGKIGQEKWPSQDQNLARVENAHIVSVASSLLTDDNWPYSTCNEVFVAVSIADPVPHL
jgi:hypothetical protein